MNDGLTPSLHPKPLDFGMGGVTGSLDAQGRIIALNFYNDAHGYVTLTSAEPFTDDKRYDPAAVRRYRKSLAALAGFGLTFDQPIQSSERRLIDDVFPEIRLTFANGGSAVMTAQNISGGVSQRWTLDGVNARWQGRVALRRCDYTQLTEGGVLPPAPTRTRIYPKGDLLIIENAGLGAAVWIKGLDCAQCVERSADGLIEIDLPVSSGELTHTFRVGSIGGAELTAPISPLKSKQWDSVPADPLVRRGITYGRAMCIPVGEGGCILTDHMLLPLSWNRDAYYVARLLLAAGGAGDVSNVAAHLIWLFEIADRPDGFWGRCYLANGQIKDPAFQLDQQLFPLLELAEFILLAEQEDAVNFGAGGARERFRSHAEAVLANLMTRRADFAPLFATDETPADDPIALPYHLSSHILMWRTLNKLREAGIAVADEYAALADSLKRAIQTYFVAERGGVKLYAYAADGLGNYHFYHDANDFPTVLAPVWGFTPADDPVWRATIDFAFSAANAGGFYQGHLGSVHTPAPWALGDIQEMVVGRITGDTARVERAWAGLRRIAQGDGALPEAYDPESGGVVSRYWFAWTNAAFACERMGAFNS